MSSNLDSAVTERRLAASAFKQQHQWSSIKRRCMLTVSDAEAAAAAAAADTMDSRRNTFTGWLVCVSLSLSLCLCVCRCLSFFICLSVSLCLSRYTPLLCSFLKRQISLLVLSWHNSASK